MRTRVELTQSGRFVVMLASLTLGAAWTTGHPAARLAACLLLAPLLVDWALKARDWQGLRVGVSLRRTRAGAPFVERVVVQNGARRALWHAHLGESGLVMSGRGQSVFLEHLPAGREVAIDLPLRARGRGLAGERTYWLSTRHPLGLVRLHAEVPSPARVVVEPARVPLPIEVPDQRTEGDVPRDLLTSEAGETFWSLRELAPGEDIGRVHALRSAALGVPVRTIERGAERAVAAVVLDLRSPPARTRLRPAGRAFEWAMSATASVVENLVARGRAVDVLVLEPGARWFRALGATGSTAQFMDYLAGAAPTVFAPVPAGTLDPVAAAGDRFWIVANGFAATDDRKGLGEDTQVLEWS